MFCFFGGLLESPRPATENRRQAKIGPWAVVYIDSDTQKYYNDKTNTFKRNQRQCGIVLTFMPGSAILIDRAPSG